MSSSTYIPDHVGGMKIVASEAIGESVPVFEVQSHKRGSSPKFRILPMGKDLNPPPFEDTPSASKVSHAYEALAVSGLVGCQDNIDFIADVEVLKKMFATPYTNAGLSLQVQRIGHTLVLNPGPEVDVDEGCKTQVDESLIQSFATQSSVTISSCGCPPTHDAQVNPKRPKIKPSGEYRGELFFCHLDNFKMLVGSEQLHQFSDGKDLDVNLHLLESSKKVTPLPWLEGWLRNVMTNVQVLGFCYHQNGIVKGYEFLHTSKICSVKGGALAFHQDVVQQNAHNVLTFLKSNCEEDPGAYWVYIRPGDDVLHLFDLSKEDTSGGTTLPSKMRSDSLFSLGKLLYMLALSSVVADDPIKCATLLRKCLNILVEQDHMVVRADAHEQFARLCLKNDIEDINSEFVDNVQGGVVSKFSDNNNYTCLYAAAPSSAPNPVSKPTTLIESKCLALYNVRQAISSLLWSQLLPGSQELDTKLWSLVLLQREAQLALGQAYYDDGKQLWESFYCVRQACFTYASMPAKLEGTSFISSMELQSAGFFSAKSWILVGDLFLLSFEKPNGELKLKSSALGTVSGNIKIKFSGSTKENTEEAVPRILQYLKPSISIGVTSNLFDAYDCYEECGKALKELPVGLSVGLSERKGRVCSEIGDLLCKETKFDQAQTWYDTAIFAFRKVPEHKGLVRQLNCKLGDLENAQAKQSVKNMNEWPSSYKQAYFKQAVSDYCKSLEYYKEAKAGIGDEDDPEEKVKVYKTLADTHLDYGILLAKQEIIDADPEQPAGAAIREALALYESSVLRKTSEQKVAEAYLELAQFMKRCCMRLLKTNQKKALQYASLANLNWRKSTSFYGAQSYPNIFLSTLVDRSCLSLALPNSKPEHALSILLEGHLLCDTVATDMVSWEKCYPGVCPAFWSALRNVLLQMMQDAKNSNDAGYKDKLKGLYLASLKSDDLRDLKNMYATWTS